MNDIEAAKFPSAWSRSDSTSAHFQQSAVIIGLFLLRGCGRPKVGVPEPQ